MCSYQCRRGKSPVDRRRVASRLTTTIWLECWRTTQRVCQWRRDRTSAGWPESKKAGALAQGILALCASTTQTVELFWSVGWWFYCYFEFILYFELSKFPIALIDPIIASMIVDNGLKGLDCVSSPHKTYCITTFLIGILQWLHSKNTNQNTMELNCGWHCSG
jgi:hypothetical protein